MSDTATVPAPAPEATPAVSSDPEVLSARDQELNALAETDLPRYRYADGGKLANEHVAVRRALKAAQEPAPPAEQAEGDDITETDGVANADASEGEAEQEAEADVGEAEAPEVDPQWDLEDYSYEAPQGQQITEAGQQLIAEYAELAHRHSMPPEAYAASIDFLRQQQARLVENDRAASKARTAELTERLGSKEAYEAYAATAREGAALMPKSLRDALKEARLPNGRKVEHMPELTEFLHSVANKQTDAAPAQHATAQDEVARLDRLMHTNIDAYMGDPWENTGKTGSERMLQLRREMAGQAQRPSQAIVDDEERRLVKLSRNDPQMFQFGSWPGARSPADRLHAIRTRRA